MKLGPDDRVLVKRMVQAHRLRGDDPWKVLERVQTRLREYEVSAHQRCCWLDGPPGVGQVICGEPAGRSEIPAAQSTPEWDAPTDNVPRVALPIPLCSEHLDAFAVRMRNNALAAAMSVVRGRRTQEELLSGPRERVYFVRRADGLIKIGFSTNVSGRIDSFRTTLGTVELLATASGGRNRESRYHRQYAEHRVHGEWFRPCPEILAEVERLNAEQQLARKRARRLSA